jgi:septal ring factor EnvC (AmiA/AmiB activator)
MRATVISLLFLAVGASGPALAVNKCTGADGRVTYQDGPCIGGRTQEVDVTPPMSVGPSAHRPSSETARLEALLSASQRSRRALELRERLLPDAEAAVRKNQAACEARHKELVEQRAALGQNRFTRGQAQQATADLRSERATCQSKDRELKANLQSLSRECASLQCRG